MSLRKILFQIHLWTGLVAGLFFIVLGLSGSALVYPSLLQTEARAPRTTTQGSPLPLEQVIAAARAVTPQSEGRAASVTLPATAADAVMVQFNPQGGGRGAQAGGRGGQRQAAGPRNAGAANGQQAGRGVPPRRGGVPQVFVDPVSGQVLAARTTVNSPLVGLAHQLHEAMLLGPVGRSLVAWLGVGMFFLGVSGLYLWWPKKGQWKFAFGVRRNARGFRFYREIHGMMGIWFWAVFLIVTATSLPLGFQTVLAMVTGSAPRGEGLPGAGPAQRIGAAAGTMPLRLTELIANAEKNGGARAVAVTVPAQPNRPVNVTLETGFGEFTPPNIAVNPYTGAVLTRPGAARNAGVTRRTIEQLHGGAGFGPVWKFLVFASGFLPLIFVVTGFMMWLKKRQNRSAVKKPASVTVRERPAAAIPIRA